MFHNINGDDNWSECFNAPNVDLPTGYYFGFSAATGDLAGLSIRLFVCLLAQSFWCVDNHDIISVKVYDIDSEDDGDNKDKKEVIMWSLLTHTLHFSMIRRLTGPLLCQKLLTLNLKDVSAL